MDDVGDVQRDRDCASLSALKKTIKKLDKYAGGSASLLRISIIFLVVVGAITWSQVVTVPSFHSTSTLNCSAHVGKRLNKKIVGRAAGNWVGRYGSKGYALAAWNGCSGTASGSDLLGLPSNIKMMVAVRDGGRYVWVDPTKDVRALESPNQRSRQAAAWFSAGNIVVTLKFQRAFSGTVTLYAVDWNSAGRVETITVNYGVQTQNAVLRSFSKGAWLSFPVTIAASGNATITVHNDASGLTAQLSGLFLE